MILRDVLNVLWTHKILIIGLLVYFCGLGVVCNAWIRRLSASEKKLEALNAINPTLIMLLYQRISKLERELPAIAPNNYRLVSLVSKAKTCIVNTHTNSGGRTHKEWMRIYRKPFATIGLRRYIWLATVVLVSGGVISFSIEGMLASTGLLKTTLMVVVYLMSAVCTLSALYVVAIAALIKLMSLLRPDRTEEIESLLKNWGVDPTILFNAEIDPFLTDESQRDGKSKRKIR